jgi:hypothetical protein
MSLMPDPLSQSLLECFNDRVFDAGDLIGDRLVHTDPAHVAHTRRETVDRVQLPSDLLKGNLLFPFVKHLRGTAQDKDDVSFRDKGEEENGQPGWDGKTKPPGVDEKIVIVAFKNNKMGPYLRPQCLWKITHHVIAKVVKESGHRTHGALRGKAVGIVVGVSGSLHLAGLSSFLGGGSK